MGKNYIYEDKNETNICVICGSDSEYYVYESEDAEDGIYYCSNCEAEYVYTGTEYRDTGELVILKGEKRDWLKYLRENLKLPCEGHVIEYQERGPVQQGDSVTVKTLDMEDGFYGVIATITVANKKHFFSGRPKQYAFPLADICASDKKSENYKILDNYSCWFANCKDIL